MPRIRLTVLIRDDWGDRYPLVLEHCRQVGLTVVRELAAIGVIVGEIDEDRLATLAEVEGVGAVEPERTNTALPRHPQHTADRPGPRAGQKTRT